MHSMGSRLFCALPSPLERTFTVRDERSLGGQQISPFRVRYLLSQGIPADALRETIMMIETQEEAAAFHAVTPGFATRKPQQGRS